MLTWGNTEQKRKWALVKWDTIFLLKNYGGTEPQDPQHNSAVMGARIWWKWISDPHTPWAILWTTKCANNTPVDDLIRITKVGLGSLIWNVAK